MKDLPSLNISIRPLHQYIHAVEFCNIWATILKSRLLIVRSVSLNLYMVFLKLGNLES